MTASLLAIVLWAACPWMQAASGAGDPHHQYVVRDLIRGIARPPVAERAWWQAFPLGDPSLDGFGDCYIAGPAFDRMLGLGVEQVLFVGCMRRGKQSMLRWPYQSGPILLSGHSALPSKAVLRSPSGLRVASLTRLPSQEVGVWDASSGSLIGYVPHPPSPIPGLSPIGFIDGIFRAGDLDSDGYDDLFFVTWQNQGYAVTGAIDGRILQVAWHHYETAWFDDHGSVLYSDNGPPSDLDGDHVPDFVASFGLYSGPNASRAHIVARSGATGGKLWHTELSGWESAGMQYTGQDVTGDDIADTVIQAGGLPNGTPQSISLLSGQDGRLVWTKPSDRLDAWLPPGATAVYSGGPLWVDRSDRGPTISRYLHWFQNFGRSGSGVALLDARTSAVMDYVSFPSDLKPWSAEPFATAQFSRILGDLDRDGFKELGVCSVPLPTMDWEGGPINACHYVVLGRRTLVLPSQTYAGDALTLSLILPSAPGLEFFLLLSERFDAGEGEIVDGWITHLAGSPLLSWSLGNRPCAGVLDASGRATRTFTLPALPVASGTDLFIRAVILESGTQDRVWTLSSVETFRYE